MTRKRLWQSVRNLQAFSLIGENQSSTITTAETITTHSAAPNIGIYLSPHEEDDGGEDMPHSLEIESGDVMNIETTDQRSHRDPQNHSMMG